MNNFKWPETQGRGVHEQRAMGLTTRAGPFQIHTDAREEKNLFTLQCLAANMAAPAPFKSEVFTPSPKPSNYGHVSPCLPTITQTHLPQSSRTHTSPISRQSQPQIATGSSTLQPREARHKTHTNIRTKGFRCLTLPQPHPLSRSHPARPLGRAQPFRQPVNSLPSPNPVSQVPASTPHLPSASCLNRLPPLLGSTAPSTSKPRFSHDPRKVPPTPLNSILLPPPRQHTYPGLP